MGPRAWLGAGAAMVVASVPGVTPAAPVPVEREVLPNGITVLVAETPQAPVVAMTLFIRAGTRYETPAENGITALLQRTLLKGTRSRSALEVALAAEETGGAVESATDQDYAELRVHGLARHWPRLLDLLAELVTVPTLPPEEIEREREILLAQIRGQEDQTFASTYKLFLRALHGPHPYSLPTTGEAESVRRLGREDLLRYFRSRYTAGRMILSVSGRVPAREVIAEAGRAFAALPPGADPPESITPPAGPGTPRLAERRPVQQAQLLVGVLAPPASHPDYPAMKVLNAVLGGGMSGRLFTTLRDREGLAYAVGSFYPTRAGWSRLAVHLGTAPGNLARAEAGIRAEFERLRAEPVPAEELARAKRRLLGSHALDRRTNARQAFYRALYELLGLGHGYSERYPALVEAVTAEEVQQVARRYLTEPVVAAIAP
ncbi:MAG: insulinase family protein [Candidatus Rokubacteria bacterium]|nr:insulinase family protein [Candidatus Rokubacteria bacterium]